MELNVRNIVGNECSRFKIQQKEREMEGAVSLFHQHSTLVARDLNL